MPRAFGDLRIRPHTLPRRRIDQQIQRRRSAETSAATQTRPPARRTASAIDATIFPSSSPAPASPHARKTSRYARSPASRSRLTPPPHPAGSQTPPPSSAAPAANPAAHDRSSGGKYVPPKIRLTVRRQKRRQRPSPLSADRRHRRLVPRIHIRPLIPVHLHRDKVRVDDLRRPLVLIRLSRSITWHQ